ncbi:MAG: dimethylargininase [Chloroflexi bacterium]|nr:dimethylargininase [Chloroflexota bacterium]MBI3341427.1 dimethylargininase [Chloroflexota bacterium]
MLIAITREISPSINQCELTFHEREPINYERACEQHKQYVNALRSLRLQVQVLPADPDLPDSVFVEDTALVLDECAIITRPGADSRKPETESITNVLEQYRKLFFVQPPARVDGGDILRVDKKIYVGLSTRSDNNAIEQMQNYLRPFGYEIEGVTVTGCLHLKSAVTQVAEDTLLINPEWADKNYFDGMKFVEIDPSEPYAANALLIGDTIIYPTAFPKTQKRLEAAGVKIVNVDADELAKAEGAVTCCSLIFKS